MENRSRPVRDGKDWSREDLTLAFDLYCRIPFQKTKATNSLVIALAHLLQRTPASIARKLGNFGAFDPELKKKKISGLIHTSKLDKEIWNEFNADWGKLVLEAEVIRQRKTKQKSSIIGNQIILKKDGPTERDAKVKQRIHQDFFRSAILAGYNQRCCICGLPHAEILVASHIIPWSVREDVRVNPENGLCLCASHDRAFDQGLIAIGKDFSVILSDRLKKSKDQASEAMFKVYDSKRISLPDRFTPRVEYLSWRLNIFLNKQ